MRPLLRVPVVRKKTGNPCIQEMPYLAVIREIRRKALCLAQVIRHKRQTQIRRFEKNIRRPLSGRRMNEAGRGMKLEVSFHPMQKVWMNEDQRALRHRLKKRYRKVSLRFAIPE